MALVFANGFFVAAEFSIVTVRKTRIDQLIVKPTELFMYMFWPFISVLNRAGRGVVQLLGLHSKGGHAMVHSEEELMMLVTASQEAGVIEEHEEQMLHRVFGFADLSAGRLMIPRTELVAVAADSSRDELVDRFTRSGHTRLPV